MHLEGDLHLRQLAREAGISTSHFIRSFRQSTGKTPHQFLLRRRVERAKNVMRDRRISLTEVALASGFSSLRRFNDVFKARCGLVPSAVRRRTPAVQPGALRLRLAYRPPFDFGYLLEAMRRRAIPGVERVTESSYARNVSAPGESAWIRVTSNATRPELILEAFGVDPARIQPLVRQMRRIFDMDADLRSAHETLARDPALARTRARRSSIGWSLSSSAVS